MQILRQALFRSLAMCFAIFPVENFSLFSILGTTRLTLPKMAASDRSKMFCFPSSYVNFRKMGLQTILFPLHP